MADQVQQAACILVVDGDVLVRHAIADYLRNCGYIVVEASSTEEAAIVLEERNLSIDAVLCDVNASGARNAFAFRAWAQQQRPGIQFVLAGNSEAAAHKAAELCDDGPQLKRPYDPQGVIEYMRRILGRARQPTAGAAG